MSRGLKGLSASAVSEHISHYSSAIECKASAFKSGLVELDAWYQSLPFSTVSSPCSGLDSKESLLKLVRWKLGREKHRPALLSLVSSNPPDLVNKTLRKAATYLVERKLTLDSDDDDLLSGVVGGYGNLDHTQRRWSCNCISHMRSLEPSRNLSVRPSRRAARQPHQGQVHPALLQGLLQKRHSHGQGYPRHGFGKVP